MTLKLSIPLRTGRGLNDRMHFMVRARKVKAERLAVGLVLNTHKAPAGPVTVNLGRVSPSAKGLDKDNLQGALKAVRRLQWRWNGMIRQGNEERYHPTQKPLEVMKWVIELCPKAETILDPFMGSGTTGVAAIQLGRSFIGIEREERYFQIACDRISNAVAQGQLFEPVRGKQIQEALL